MTYAFHVDHRDFASKVYLRDLDPVYWSDYVFDFTVPISPTKGAIMNVLTFDAAEWPVSGHLHALNWWRPIISYGWKIEPVFSDIGDVECLPTNNVTMPHISIELYYLEPNMGELKCLMMGRDDRFSYGILLTPDKLHARIIFAQIENVHKVLDESAKYYDL